MPFRALGTFRLLLHGLDQAQRSLRLNALSGSGDFQTEKGPRSPRSRRGSVLMPFRALGTFRPPQFYYLSLYSILAHFFPLDK